MRASRWIFLTLALGLVFGNASNALAEVYRWKDSKGVVHFGDQPLSTDPQVVKKVAVPSPNLAKAFQPNPKAHVVEEEETAPGNASEAIGIAPPTPPSRGIAAKSQGSCKAKVAAYRASVACFSACGLNNGGNNSGRNNAGCGHCADLPMPNC